MDVPSLPSLAAELVSAISLLSHYPPPPSIPPVMVLPQAEMQARFCNGPCRVRAAYDPEHGVFLDERLDLVRDPVDRSILLHELVHHVQAQAGRFDPDHSECQRASRDEREAYEIQNLYLASLNVARRFPLPRFAPACRETSARQ